MLVELAIGDAYGAGFEYVPQDFVRRRNLLFSKLFAGAFCTLK